MSFPWKREPRAGTTTLGPRFRGGDGNLLSCALSVVTTIAFASFGFAAIAAADTIYVSNEKDNTITVVDGKTLESTKTVPVGQRPRGILLSKDAKSLYICASDSDHIEVLDLTSDQVVRTLPSGADPEYFALDPGGKLLYIANEDDNLVTIVDIERGEVVSIGDPRDVADRYLEIAFGREVGYEDKDVGHARMGDGTARVVDAWLGDEFAERRAVALRPDYPEAWFNLANVRLARSELAEAEDALRRAVTFKSDYGPAFFNLGIVLQDRGRPDEAAKAFADYLDAHGKSGGEGLDAALAEWGWVLLDAGKPADADRAFARLLSEYPDSPRAGEARLNLAESAYQAKNYDEVARLLGPLVAEGSKADPVLVQSALYRLGRTLQVIGMILLPLAVAGNLSPENTLSLRMSLVLSGVGVGVFILGYLLQQASRT